MTTSRARFGTVIVRVWTEDDTVAGFRARVACTDDTDARSASTTAVASVEDAVTVVRAYLERLAGVSDAPVTDG